MNGFVAFLVKEMLEIRRTWRLWVLPGILLAVALTSPILAALTPRLLESMTNDQPGLIIQIPDPTSTDAFLQFVQSLMQIVLLALIIVTAAMVSGERRSGTAILVLTKPVSRASFLVAKFIAQMTLIILALVPAAALCWLVTYLVFEEAPALAFIQSMLVFAVVTAFFVAVMLVFSTLVNSQAGAAGLGLLVYLVFTILTAWGPTHQYSPAGLYSAVGNLITGADTPVIGPVITGLLATAALISLAILIFSRQEQSGRMGSG